MKKKNILSLLVLLLFIIFGVTFLKSHFHEFKGILNVNPLYLIPLFFLAFLKSVFNGLELKILMKVYNINLKIKEWFGLEVATLLGNLLTPFKGGTPIRLVYLKRKYQAPYTYSVATIGSNVLTDIFALSGFGLFLSLFAPLQNEIRHVLSIVFGTLFLLSIFILFFLPLPIKWDIKLVRHLIRSVNELTRIRAKDHVVFNLISLTLIILFVNALMMYISFYAFGFTAPFYACLLIRIILVLSVFVSITPQNLGIQEAIIIASSSMIGSDTLTGTFAALLYRAVGTAFILIAGPIFSFILFRESKNDHKKDLSPINF